MFKSGLKEPPVVRCKELYSKIIQLLSKISINPGDLNINYTKYLKSVTNESKPFKDAFYFYSKIEEIINEFKKIGPLIDDYFKPDRDQDLLESVLTKINMLWIWLSLIDIFFQTQESTVTILEHNVMVLEKKSISSTFNPVTGLIILELKPVKSLKRKGEEEESEAIKKQRIKYFSKQLKNTIVDKK
jgi:hypothetical protein